jgi:ABC-2 type transport system ATP-binding protein
MPAVAIERLTHLYGRRQALAAISLSIARGEIFGILGPNGGGKTTLFRILSTLMTPSSGSVHLFGEPLTASAHQIRRRLGVVFQSPSLDRQLTVTENLRHQGHLYGLRGAALETRINELLERLGVADRTGELVKRLSGGLQRRVEVAKSLLHQPSLLLLDEPTTGLDPGARRDLWKYLEMLRQRDGVTIVLTTHLMEDAERCDRLAILDAGAIVAVGTPAALKAEIGGNVITITADAPEVLRERIRDRLGVTPQVVGGLVRIEHADGHTFVPKLVQEFPTEIRAVTLAKPTLEDVFIHRTGHRLDEEGKRDAG